MSRSLASSRIGRQFQPGFAAATTTVFGVNSLLSLLASVTIFISSRITLSSRFWLLVLQHALLKPYAMLEHPQALSQTSFLF